MYKTLVSNQASNQQHIFSHEIIKLITGKK